MTINCTCYSFLLVTLLSFHVNAHGQTHCAVGYLPASNEIEYNESEIETVIDFTKSRAVLFGEGHTRDFDPAFKFKFIRHLNKRFGYRHVFMEIGYSAAYLFNLFLEKGDTSIFEKYKPVYGQRSYRAFWNNLYHYNKVLPDTAKIVIHGIDFERKDAFKVLVDLRQRSEPVPNHLSPIFDRIEKTGNDSSVSVFDKVFAAELKTIKEAHNKYTQDFKRIYGDHYAVVSDILNNSAPQSPKVHTRNKEWIVNLKKIVARQNIDRLIGFFGKAHLFYDNKPSMATYIDELQPFTGKLVNITSIYHHFLSMGYKENYTQVTEYEHSGRELYDRFANKECRATILPTRNLNNDLKKKADFVIFAKDVVD